MKVLIKKPGRMSVLSEIENDLETMQNIVGGYIEVVTVQRFGKEVAVICNEEGRLQGLPFNCVVDGIPLVGTLIMCGVDGEDFTDIPEEVLQ